MMDINYNIEKCINLKCNLPYRCRFHSSQSLCAQSWTFACWSVWCAESNVSWSCLLVPVEMGTTWTLEDLNGKFTPRLTTRKYVTTKLSSFYRAIPYRVIKTPQLSVLMLIITQSFLSCVSITFGIFLHVSIPCFLLLAAACDVML